jgi:hypothetical protein
MTGVTLPKLTPNRSQGALKSTGRSMASQGSAQSMSRVQTAPNLKMSGSLTSGFWGEGPKNAGSTKWRRDRRLERQCDVFEADSNPATPFRRMYDRGDLPLTIKSGAVRGIEWKVKQEDLDYSTYLPIFFEGLREKTEPYTFIALMGSRGMIQAGLQSVDAAGTKAAKLLPIVPQLILPMKRGFFTRDPATIVKVLEALQLLVRDPSTGVGEALVPYYRQLLPVLNIYKPKKLNLGDGIDYGQAKRDFRNIGELIEETLNLLEVSGGPDAFINIKYMIPTYESCMKSR